MPSEAVGIESRVIGDSDISSSSVLNQHFAEHARLNELGEFWCSNNTDASSWLQVFLGRQYTLTHIAIQGINEFDVRAMTVKYEKTQDGENWTTYSKSFGGNVNAKVVFVKDIDIKSKVVQLTKLQITVSERNKDKLRWLKEGGFF